MNRHQQRVMLLLGLLLISAAMLGCANHRAVESTRVTPSPYEQDFVRARAGIADAEQAGAAEFGGPQLTLRQTQALASEVRSGLRTLEDELSRTSGADTDRR